MKTGLAAAIAAAILLLGSLVYWKTRPAESSEPEVPAPAAAPVAGSTSELSVEAAGPESNASAAGEPEAARSAAAPAPIPPPALATDLASPPESPVENIQAPVPATIEEARGSADEVFEKRYAGKSADERRAASESLRVLLYASQEGEIGKGQALTDEQIQEFKREIEWLSMHEFP